MKIHRPSLRLALWYELIVVCISLAYSIAVYQISTRQIESGLRQQVDIFQQRQPNSYPFQTYEDELLTAQLQEVRRRLLITLVIINSIIVVAAGGTSYILARRTLRPIEESLEQQRRFTADASHELRTPLAAMQAEIEVALRAATANPQEYAQVLQSNLEEIHRLERLSHGLLRLARGEKQNTSFQAKPTPVSAVVDDAIRQVTPHAERKNITIDRAEIS